jgi:Zn/Cd-binding protein ZinT
MCYSYPGMIDQVQAANLSIWNNKWLSVFDFTKNPNGELNYRHKKELNPDFVITLKNMKVFTNAYMKFKGVDTVESITDVLAYLEENQP